MTELVKQENTGMLAIISNAVDKGLDVNALDKLLSMQERIMKKNAEIAFNNAKSRLNFPQIVARSEIRHNGKLISKYAKYEEIDKIVRPLYSKEGFSVSFDTVMVEGKELIRGKLCHTDGHFETAEMTLPLDTGGAKNNVQAIGSTLTYGKRYVLCMLLNIVVTGEDDDAQGANEVITVEQGMNINDLITKVGADKAAFLKYLGVDELNEIRAIDYQKAISALNAKAKKSTQ